MQDLAGNVWEWVADWHDSDYYDRSPSHNPTGPSSGEYRVLRGGSWNSVPHHVRSANRLGHDPDCMINLVGFRCARGSEYGCPSARLHLSRYWLSQLGYCFAGDFDGDGRIELLVPNQARTSLGAIRRKPGGAEVAWTIPVGGGVMTNLATVAFPDNTVAVGVGHEGNMLRLWLP